MKSKILSTLCALVLTTATIPGYANSKVDITTEGFSRDLYILAIGINKYVDAPQLLNAVPDAVGLAAVLEREGKGAFHTIKKTVLTDEQATRKNIEAAFNDIASEATPEDAFVFHFAGMGGKFAQRQGEKPLFYLKTSDARWRESATKAVTPDLLSVWCSKVQARQQLILLDTDDIGNAFDKMAEDIVGKNQQVAQLVGKNVVVLGPNGTTMDVTEFKHGEFTNVLLEGLGGEADLTGDRKVTVRELQAYLYSRLPKQRVEIDNRRKRRVQEELRGQLQKAQTPEERSEVLKRLNFSSHILPGRHQEILIPKSVSIGADWVLVAKVAAPEDATDANSRDVQAASAFRPSPPAEELPGKRYALLFAVESYDDGRYTRLKNPVYDAQQIAADLRQIYGYEAEVVMNPTIEEITDTFGRYMQRKYEPNDQLFIFFAGHGTFLDLYKEGFVIARDSRAGKEMQTALSFSNLHSLVDRIECNHIMLTLDTCFGGTFIEHVARSFNRASRNNDDPNYTMLTRGQRIARKLKFRSRKLIASGTGPVSDGIPNRHSPFAFRLLEALRNGADRDGILTFGKVMEYIGNVSPGPIDINFGSYQPGSDFIFIAPLPQR